KVDQQPIPQMLRYMSVIAPNHFSTGFLVRTDDLAQFFRVKSRRERSRINEVTEHHGQLPPFTVTPSGIRHPKSGVLFFFAVSPFPLFAFAFSIYAFNPNEYLSVFIRRYAFCFDE